jgi:multicomponent Na+:H+ antiporter subunit E
MKKWPLNGIALAVLWLFVRGVSLTPDAIIGEFLIGLAVGMPLSYLLRGFYRPRVSIRGSVRSAWAAIAYLALFTKELLTANVDVARRVLSPSMPIEPAVIELPLRVETDLAITTIANSITLTPGTLTMDYDEEANLLYIHAITGEDREAIVKPIRRWEDRALEMFAEDGTPDDPVPATDGGDSDGE